MPTVRKPGRRDGFHVLIAGGGVAALETLLALHTLAGHRVKITLLSPADRFLYRPVTVAEAFECGEAPEYELDQIVADHGGVLRNGRLIAVNADKREAITTHGDRIPYDALV